MDDSDFERAVKRLKAVNAVVKDLDPVLREQAVTLLTPYITGGANGGGSGSGSRAGSSGKDGRGGTDGTEETVKKHAEGAVLDLDAMVEEFASDKDHENALLALAVYYHREGKGPFALKELKTIGENEMNIDLPNRMDVTFGTLKRDGSVVLRKQADGTWKVTPTGEKWLKATFGVSKGRGTPASS